MIANKDLIGWTIIAAVEPAGFFNCMCPNWSDAHQIQRDPEQLMHLRASYKPAVGLGLALGVGLSLLAGSPLPLLAAGATSVAMVSIYESALPPDVRLLPWGNGLLRDPRIIDGTFRVID